MLLILVIVVSVLVFGPMIWVRRVMSAYSGELPGMPGTGGELAQHLVKRFDLDDVLVEQTDAGDHYDPIARRVRLSSANFEGRSLTAVAVATHEVGHALQHKLGDKKLAARTRLAPLADQLARVSAGAIWLAPVMGLVFRHPVPFSLLIGVGLSGLVARMFVHVVTLPIEWDASFGKALPILEEGRYVAPEEIASVSRILRAAALTYAAAALADVLNLARWAAILLRR
jgi:Zn-dependent membrane protease YugP